MTVEVVTKEDAEALLEIYAPYVTDTAISFEYEVPTVAEFAHRIETISARYPYLKAVENGQVLGYAYANTFKGRPAYDWSVETTIYVRREARRGGVGRALYEALTSRLQAMGILNMNACIAVPRSEDPHLTDDSIRFHAHMGFTPVGIFHASGYKFDTWYDMEWMEKMIGDHWTPQSSVHFGQK